MFKAFFIKIGKSNNQQFGHLLGMFIGAGVGYYALSYPTIGTLPVIGSLGGYSQLFIQLLTVPFTSGLFANIFSNLGSGIDVLTDNRTIVSLVKFILSKTSQEKQITKQDQVGEKL